MKSRPLSAAFLSFVACLNIVAQETIKDVDGNVYKTVNIGKQTWMAENLRVENYRNGDFIFTLVEGSFMTWNMFDEGAYGKYDNSDELAKKHGLLYNWYTVADGRHVCPEGWRIPTSEDFEALIKHLDPSGTPYNNKAGGKMKSKSIWQTPNVGATNSSGFNALPAGLRRMDGEDFNLMQDAFFWTTDIEGGQPVAYRLNHYSETLEKTTDYPFRSGFSIRCIKE